jgi:chromosome segregation and condensation protein ScpB
MQVSDLPPARPPNSAGEPGLGSAGELAGSVRARREQLGWSQSRLARASGVSRTVVNEVENGRRSPSLPTYDKLRRALGLDLAASLALLPTAAPAAPSERFLTTVAATLITTGRVELADAAAALQVDATAVRAAVAQLANRLAAVGVAAVDDGVTIELTVLGYAAEPVERLRALETVPTLTTEAVMTLVIVGHLGEATRRDVDERRGADSTSVLDRLVARGLLTQRTDQTIIGRPNTYRLTTRALTLVGHSTLESFQAWCRQQTAPTDQPARVPGPVPTGSGRDDDTAL